MAIQANFLVYNADFEYLHSAVNDREEAEGYAKRWAERNDTLCAVMLAVPVGGTDMPELRALTVYDARSGAGAQQVFRTGAYDREMVPA